MITKKENLLETIRCGHPDRFVNQFEPFYIGRKNPFTRTNKSPKAGELNIVNAWGVTRSWPVGNPGPFPVHDEAHTVCRDIEHWRSDVKAPNVVFPAEQWAPFQKEWAQVDQNEYFLTAFIAPGLFEQCHYLLEMQNFLTAFYEEPEALHELIDYLKDWEMQYAEQLCTYMKPTALFHHDDWGSQLSTFIAPAMFEEFFLPAYREIYGCYKAHGVEVIVHHSDSYAATLVPDMIEMGVDIWQGVMTSNDIPALIEKYGGQITFMGGIESASVDYGGWTRERVAEVVSNACRTFGRKAYIPNTTMGGASSIFPGVYEAVSAEIDKMSAAMF